MFDRLRQKISPSEKKILQTQSKDVAHNLRLLPNFIFATSCSHLYNLISTVAPHQVPDDYDMGDLRMTFDSSSLLRWHKHYAHIPP